MINTSIKTINDIQYNKKMLKIFNEYSLIYSDIYQLCTNTLDDVIFDELSNTEYDMISSANCTDKQYNEIYFNALYNNGVKRFFIETDFFSDNAMPYFLFDINALSFTNNEKIYINDTDDKMILVCNNQYSYTDNIVSVLINECILYYDSIPVYDIVILPKHNQYVDSMFDYEIFVKQIT